MCTHRAMDQKMTSVMGHICNSELVATSVRASKLFMYIDSVHA